MRSIVFLLPLLLQACWPASLDQQHWCESLEHESLSAGVSRTFSASAATTLKAAEDAVVAVGLYQQQICPGSTPTDPKPACDGLEVAHFGVDTLAFYAFPDRQRGWDGRQVRVVVAGHGPNESTVYILSKRSTTTVTHGRGDYSSVILNAVSARLNQHL